MGKLSDRKLQEEECEWQPSKHHGQECPKHGYESDLTDDEIEGIKKAGGKMDGEKEPLNSEEESWRRVHRTETIFKNRIDSIVSNPEEYFKKSQIQRIHNYSKMLEISEKKFLERVATKMVVSRFSPEQAIEWAYKKV